jgi:Fe2+ or Zn2+ uptake regulation protein
VQPTSRSLARDHRLQRVLGLLRTSGCRVTTTRVAIVRTLLSRGGHVTAQQLADDVRRSHPEVHPSSVYRCLDTLVDVGVVHHAHLGHGAAVFHLTDERHEHLVCDGCGAVTEVPSDVLDELAERLGRGWGFTLQRGHGALSGRCRDCM